MDSFLSKHLNREQLERISGARIGIAGLGGLGSNAANFLVRSGFANFTLIDFDIVEASNLNRQFYFAEQIGQLKCDALFDNLMRISKDLSVKKVCIKITESNIENLFVGCDIIIEAFDNPLTKVMLINKLSKSKKLIVSASGIGATGNFEKIKIEKFNNVYIVGDGISEISDTIHPYAPRVNLIAALQADIVLDALLNRHI